MGRVSFPLIKQPIMVGLFFGALVATWCVGASHGIPAVLRVLSSEVGLKEVAGEYELDGKEEGYPRWRRISDWKEEGDHILARNARGAWFFAKEAREGSGKGGGRKTAALSVWTGSPAESPLGLPYKRYAGDGVWAEDPTLKLADATSDVALRRAKEREALAALSKAESEAALAKALAAREAASAAMAREAAARERARKKADAEDEAREAATREAHEKLAAERRTAEEKLAVEYRLGVERQARIDEIKAEKAAARQAVRDAEEDRLAMEAA